jgi:Transglycosylase SLT domain/SPOR domain
VSGLAALLRSGRCVALAAGIQVAVAVLALGDPLPRNPEVAIADSTCGIVESAAHANHVPVALLTRLVWTESRFRAGAISPKGAEGIAQFMPDTAAERGLADPFDPEAAIPKAAGLLADLSQRFGNLGLAAAAYNAGPNRVAEWLDGGSLPVETQLYVIAVTGRPAAEWAADRRNSGSVPVANDDSCSAVTAQLRAGEGEEEAPIAPWGVQLAGNFSKAIALSSFDRARRHYATVIGDRQPMVIGSVLRSRGTRRFYRVLLPAASRTEADRLCAAILANGGACVALRT